MIGYKTEIKSGKREDPQTHELSDIDVFVINLESDKVDQGQLTAIVATVYPEIVRTLAGKDMIGFVVEAKSFRLKTLVDKEDSSLKKITKGVLREYVSIVEIGSLLKREK